MNNVYVHISKDSQTPAHRWITATADRAVNTGTAYVDFEFLQKTLTKDVNPACANKPPCGGFTSAGTDGGRTVGDILLTAQYGSGGTVATIIVYRWEAVSGGFQLLAQTTVIVNLPIEHDGD